MSSKISDTNQKLTQRDRFEKAAKELCADESEERFDEALRRIAKAPPDDKRPKDKSKKEKPGQ